MTSKLAALWIALACGTGAASVAAQVPPPPAAAEPKISVSKKAHKAIVELQAAVDSRNPAAVASALAAAQAAATTPEDRFVIAQLQLKNAAASNDLAAARAAADAMAATGLGTPAKMAPIYLNLAKVLYNGKQWDGAGSALERVLALNPGDADAMILLAETRNAQGRKQEAVSLIQQAIKKKSGSGHKVQEEWYRRGIALAYDAKVPATLELSREWIAAYPSAQSWRDALRLYRNMQKPDEAATLDVLRLSRLTGALSGDNDFHLYAANAIEEGAAAEAKALLEEAAAAKQIDGNKLVFKEASAFARTRLGTGQAGLAALEKDALAAPAARLAVRTAGSLYGYGEYARAAALYRAALGKSGADADLVNLRLGMALARAGDKAGATAAFTAVQGPRAELAKYWLVYLRNQS